MSAKCKHCGAYLDDVGMCAKCSDQQPSELSTASCSVWVAWKCPVCGRSNDRKQEGLDTCDHCKCDVATYYGTAGETLNVKWYRK